MCTPAWLDGDEDKSPFGPDGIWVHSSEEDLLGADYPMRGALGDYPLGGFLVTNTSTTEAEFIAMVSWLRQNRWVDTQTRLVTLDFNVWNPTLRLILAIKLQAEFSVVGKVRTMYTVRTFEYKEWVEWGRVYWWWEMVYVVLILTYALEEVWDFLSMHCKLRKSRTAGDLGGGGDGGEDEASIEAMVDVSLQAKREFAAVRRAIDDYVSDPWNYMDWLNYVMACVVIFMEAWSRHLLHESTADLNGATAELSSNGTASTSGGFDAPSFYGLYVCFYRAARMSAMAYTFMGVNAVVTWLKLLKYLNLFPHLSMLSITLRNAAYPAISFSVMFAIVFCSCGQAFNLAFGAQLRDFSTFSRSMMSLFRALLGDFDYTSIEEADRVVGPILFTVFIFLVVFVLLNMFIAILTVTRHDTCCHLGCILFKIAAISLRTGGLREGEGGGLRRRRA